MRSDHRSRNFGFAWRKRIVVFEVCVSRLIKEILWKACDSGPFGCPHSWNSNSIPEWIAGLAISKAVLPVEITVAFRGTGWKLFRRGKKPPVAVGAGCSESESQVDLKWNTRVAASSKSTNPCSILRLSHLNEYTSLSHAKGYVFHTHYSE